MGIDANDFRYIGFIQGVVICLYKHRFQFIYLYKINIENKLLLKNLNFCSQKIIIYNSKIDINIILTKYI